MIKLKHKGISGMRCDRTRLMTSIELMLIFGIVCAELLFFLPLIFSSLNPQINSSLSVATSIAMLVFSIIYLSYIVLYLTINIVNNAVCVKTLSLILLTVLFCLIDVFVLLKIDIVTYCLTKTLILLLYINSSVKQVSSAKELFHNAYNRLNTNAYIYSSVIILSLIALMCALYIYIGPILTIKRYSDVVNVNALRMSIALAIEVALFSIVAIFFYKKCKLVLLNSDILFIEFVLALNTYLNIGELNVIITMTILFPIINVILLCSTIYINNQNV